MIDEINEINEMLEEMNNSKIYENIAKSYRKLYTELMKMGFTKDEAMVLLSSQGLYLKTN